MKNNDSIQSNTLKNCKSHIYKPLSEKNNINHDKTRPQV